MLGLSKRLFTMVDVMSVVWIANGGGGGILLRYVGR